MSRAVNDPVEVMAARRLLEDLDDTDPRWVHGASGCTISIGRLVQLARQGLDVKAAPRFGTSQVPQTVVLTVVQPGGSVDIYLNFMSDAEQLPGRSNPSVTVVGQGRLTEIRAEPVNLQVTWRQPDEDEPGAVVTWRALVGLGGLLSMLAQGHVPANLAEQAATMLGKIDLQVAAAVQR